MRQAKPVRSALFVPGNREDRMQKAPRFGADALILDLEDAVPPAQKAAALEAAAMALAAHDWGRKTVVVRLNAIDSPSIQEEIKRLGDLPRLDAFLIRRKAFSH